MGFARNTHPVTRNFTGTDMFGEPLWNASDVNATIALDDRVAVGSDWNKNICDPTFRVVIIICSVNITEKGDPQCRTS